MPTLSHKWRTLQMQKKKWNNRMGKELQFIEFEDQLNGYPQYIAALMDTCA